MIPPFDKHGLLPPGEHLCTLEEIAERFAYNSVRKTLFEGLRSFLAQKHEPLGVQCPIYVAGSFTRRSESPEDVDIVIDFTGKDTDTFLKGLLFRLYAVQIKEEYHVDVWLKHPQIQIDLKAYFSYVGPKAGQILNLPMKHPRGVLLIK